MTKLKIGIIGANGFIGQHLSNLLIKKNEVSLQLFTCSPMPRQAGRDCRGPVLQSHYETIPIANIQHTKTIRTQYTTTGFDALRMSSLVGLSCLLFCINLGFPPSRSL